ncbi:membrane protein [Bartonella vinsonii]|uniref:membrane protein n=1 Tax=Bartonella vinsonii TaxID=33047 RepID=UPI0003471AA6|nr:membrane protein [Bartonella vinsonii]
MIVIDRILLVLWAVILAFFCVSLVGTMHILSRIFPIAYIGNIADILFFFLSALFAGILWWSIPQPMSLKMKLAAFLPLALILFFFTMF